MKNQENEIENLAKEFKECKEILKAIGDETRQHMILTMMQKGRCQGVRVGDITKCTHLSRPAVSHHLQILKAAGILKVRKEGTKNYYYFNPDMEVFDRVIHVLTIAKNPTAKYHE